MNDYKIIDLIKYEYLKTMNNDKYNQKQKNIKYASLMTVIENHFHINILCDFTFKYNDIDETLANNVKSLYLKLSNARNFDIYD